MDEAPDVTATPVLVDALVQLTFAVHEILTRAVAPVGLSVSQLRLLGILRDRTPPMTAIAEHLGLDRSSVTGLVDRAERRGLVVRIPSDEDARVTLVRVTEAGAELVGQLAAVVVTEIEALVEPVGTGDRDAVVRAAGMALGGRGPFGFEPTVRRRP